MYIRHVRHRSVEYLVLTKLTRRDLNVDVWNPANSPGNHHNNNTGIPPPAPALYTLHSTHLTTLRFPTAVPFRVYRWLHSHHITSSPLLISSPSPALVLLCAFFAFPFPSPTCVPPPPLNTSTLPPLPRPPARPSFALPPVLPPGLLHPPPLSDSRLHCCPALSGYHSADSPSKTLPFIPRAYLYTPPATTPSPCYLSIIPPSLP
jgi:hypothetical protein